MKGLLEKDELDTWLVIYKDTENGVKEVPLHPSDYSKVSDGDEVEFELEEECGNYDGKHFGRDCSCREGFIKYAKLKQHEKI